MTPEERKAKLEQLERESKELSTKIAALATEKGKDESGKVKGDAIDAEEVQRMIASVLEKHIPKQRKMVFTNGDVSEGEDKVSFKKFLKMVRYNHPELIKTVMSEGTDAQGGYTVPTGYSADIIGELNEAVSIVPKCTALGQAFPTQNIPKWLTDLAVTWVAEAGDKSKSKPTLEQKQSVLKKMAVIVTMTDELLEDNISNLDSKIAELVGENMAVEIERVALIGDVTGAGDPFNGIYYAAGTNTVTQLGASLGYLDVVGIWNNANVNSKYSPGSEWYLNKTSLGLVMQIVDLQNRPLWNLGSLSAGLPANILGNPYNISEQITNTLGAGSNKSAIFFGNYKYIVLGEKLGNAGITVTPSQSAVTESGGTIDENAYVQDETWFRFVMRKGILVSIPEAFSVGIEIG